MTVKTVQIAGIVFMAALLVAARSLFAQKIDAPKDDFTVNVVVDVEREMSASIFPKTDPEILRKYMPDGKAPSTISTFLLRVGDEFVLFDTAFGSANWTKNLEKHGVKAEQIKLVILTHMHGDHVTGLLDGEKRRFPDAKVLSAKREYDYWLPRDGKIRTPQLEKIKKLYGDDFSETFEFDQTVYSNGNVRVKAIDAVGHTPGHTAFLIESDSKRFLIVADLLHAAALQFPNPGICPTYDMDSKKAVKSRRRILDFAAKEKLPIGGMHLPTPCIGTVEKNDSDGYEFTPIE